jgi:Zn-finger nucleic acid-binding protein
MQKKAFKGVLIDHCATCQSVWLDKNELEQLVAGVGEDVHTLKAEARAEMRTEAARPMTILSACPKCQVGQIREQLIDGVKLDYCTHCGGLYFDRGELDEAINNKQEGVLKRWQRRLFGG